MAGAGAGGLTALSGPLGAIIAAVVGVVIAVVASVSLVAVRSQAPAPIDEPYVVYGSASPTTNNAS